MNEKCSMDEKCPLCGTHGKGWENEPDIFRCPNCSTLYSQFGLVVETQQHEGQEFWT